MAIFFFFFLFGKDEYSAIFIVDTLIDRVT